MSAKGQTTSLCERVEIGERWKGGQTDRQIAEAMQRPLATIRKWRRRNQHQGRAGLASRMGRPKRGPLDHVPADLVRALGQMRKAHPGWGPITLLKELEKDDRFTDQPLPSRSRLAAYLKAAGLVKTYERHQAPPEPKPTTLERPHQEWEVDAQGKLPVDGLGGVSIINIADVVSHLKIASLPCTQTTHANTPDYQLILRQAFVQYGLPEQISLDHDTVFYDSQTNSPFPTVLHLWLIGLGIGVRFIHKSPPAEHARIERMHQLMTQQAVLGQSFQDVSQLQTQLTGRINFLNQDYPSSSLQGQSPLSAYPQATHTRRTYRLEWEKDELDLQRVYGYLAQGRWFRQTSSAGNFSLGAQRYNARIQNSSQTLEITFDPHTHELICLPEDAIRIFRLESKGLTKEALMGELDPLNSLPAYQLGLPFSRQSWRELTICEGLPGTTL
jgi:Helix-turn-helix domain